MLAKHCYLGAEIPYNNQKEAVTSINETVYSIQIDMAQDLGFCWNSKPPVLSDKYTSHVYNFPLLESQTVIQ